MVQVERFVRCTVASWYPGDLSPKRPPPPGMPCDIIDDRPLTVEQLVIVR